MKIRFVLIGCGRIAERHLQYIQKLGELVAVCDIVLAKAQIYKEKSNANAYTNIDDLFLVEKEIDVVVVCTPNGLHADHSIKALNAGCHVLCEKPMALTTNDCCRMIKAAETAGKLLFIVKQNRFNPPVVAVKEVIEKGILGKVYSFQLNCFWNRNEKYYQNSWKGTKHLDGGTLFTQFSHFIDLLYWLLGDVKQVKSITANAAHEKIIEFEDTGVAIVEMMSKAIGTINYTVNSYNKNMEGSLTIFGEKGTVKIGGEYLNKLEYQQINHFEIKDLPAGNPANDYGSYRGSMSNHDKVYENLLDVLLHNAPMSMSAFEGMKTVEIIEKIYRSSI